MRVGLISYNGQARDAIGNHLAEKLSFFAESGADVRVFLQSADRLHPGLANHVHVVDRVRAEGPVWDFLAGADLVLFDLAKLTTCCISYRCLLEASPGCSLNTTASHRRNPGPGHSGVCSKRASRNVGWYGAPTRRLFIVGSSATN